MALTQIIRKMSYGVIFDMDGVIIDSEPIHFTCEKEMFKQFGIAVSDEEHNRFVGTPDETMWSILDSRYGLPVKIAEAIQLCRSLYMSGLKKYPIVPIPHIPELLAELAGKGFSLALASSSPHEQINYILETFGFKAYFQATVSGEDVREGKPNPDIFLKAAQMAGVAPWNCLVIEDSHHGVTAAKKAGMTCIGFVNPNSGSQDLSQADQIVHSFRDISAGMIRSLLRPA